jgi:RNA polymerase sigma factor (TIGR02999 family)
MRELSSQQVTQLLIAWSGGEGDALAELMPVVYGELRRLARQYMNREGPNRSLETTALVHEAYLRLIDQERVKWQNRAHFFGISAQLMRRILVDMARARRAQRRGGSLKPLSLDEAAEVSKTREPELLALDDALTELAKVDERRSRVVELRFFGGLTVEETAEVLKVSPDTVLREWKRAKAWLYCALDKSNG